MKVSGPVNGTLRSKYLSTLWQRYVAGSLRDGRKRAGAFAFFCFCFLVRIFFFFVLFFSSTSQLLFCFALLGWALGARSLVLSAKDARSRS